MKRKKKPVVFNEPEIVEGFVARNIDTPEPSTGKSRITLHVTEDGIDWERSAEPDEVLQAITNDPTMLEKIATCPDFQDSPTDGSPALVTDEEAGLVLDVLTSVEGMIFSGISKKVLGMKIDSKVVNKNFHLTEEDHKRQDPLAAQGLNMLQEFLQLDPRWRWAVFLTMAHGASLVRNVKNCVMDQYSKEDLTPENPATQDNIKKEQVQ